MPTTKIKKRIIDLDATILDEDDFISDSPTRPASQQSTKAFVESKIIDEDSFASNSDTKVPTQQSTVEYIKNIMDSLIPVGSYKEKDTLFPSIPEWSSIWLEANGQFITDAESIFNGKRTRNLNGAEVILSLNWVVDAGGSYAVVSENDRTAINVGDWVTGTGIAALAFVIDYNETTGRVTISDTAAVGVKSTIFKNDGIYIGGGEGSVADQFQRHEHSGTSIGYYYLGYIPPGSYWGFYPPAAGSTDTVIEKAGFSKPRSGTRTRPHTRKFKYYMRIK